jgi:hypothetical protein
MALALLLATGAHLAAAAGETTGVREAAPDLTDAAARIARSAPGTLGLSYALTDDALFVYSHPALAPLVPHAVRTFHGALDWQRRVFGWQPSDRPTVWLRDFSDSGNASVSPRPRNLLLYNVAPMVSPFETAPSAERMYSTMNHELVHLATGDVANARDRFWRRLFGGKVAPDARHPETLLYSELTAPRWSVPRWHLEGSAVFLETWMGGGLGRAQGGYDEMVFRAMVRDGAPFFDPLSLSSRGTRVDFQVGANAYLYGTRFFSWLALSETPAKVLQWLQRDEGSRAGYAEQFEHVFGQPLDTAWQRWVADEQRFQQANLEALRRHPITPRQPLVAAPLGSVSRGFIDERAGLLLAGVRRPGVVDHLAAIDLNSGQARQLTDVEGAVLYDVTSLAWDAASRVLFFTIGNHAWRSVWAYELDNGRRTELLREARIGAIAFNPADRSLLGVRHEHGHAQLVRVPFPYVGWETLHRFDFGVLATDLDVSPDGRLLAASVQDTRGDQFVRVFRIDRLRAGDAEPVHQFRFGPAAPEGFVFTPDGRYLLGSAYFTGVSNLYRIELDTGRVEAVSNTETGLFRPIPRADGSVVAFEYTGQGFVPVALDPQPLAALGTIRFLGAEVAERHPEVLGWQVPPSPPAETLLREQGPYHPLQHMTLRGVFPVLQGYRDTGGAGLHVQFGDPLGLAQLGITAAITPGQGLPADERGHLEITGRYLHWSAGLSWNRSSFYDLVGPTRRGRRGLAATLGHERPLVDAPTHRIESRSRLALYDGLDALPDAQNVQAAVGRLVTAELGLHYSAVQRGLTAVDDQKGVVASATVTLSHAAGSVITQPVLRLDLGTPLPLTHASLWSRTALGSTAGTRSLPAARHYFGAFGNNWVDDGAVRRYREPGSLPGFEIDAVSGRSYLRQMVELNLPPLVFASLGTPGLHLQSLRSSVFAAGLWTEPWRGERRGHATLGAQADLRLSVLHWYDMMLSFGWATGYSSGRRVGSEWMVSLKLL